MGPLCAQTSRLSYLDGWMDGWMADTGAVLLFAPEQGAMLLSASELCSFGSKPRFRIEEVGGRSLVQFCPGLVLNPLALLGFTDTSHPTTWRAACMHCARGALPNHHTCSLATVLCH